jgi:hypothetical protein
MYVDKPAPVLLAFAAKKNYGHATRPGRFLNFAPWRLLCRALAKKLC